MKTKEQYPYIKKLGLTIITRCPNSIPGIDGRELHRKLTKEQSKLFFEYFGCQTMGENGMYIYNVEAVLERIFSGKLTGTQFFWD